MARRPFAKFKNKILVESGTYMGDGVQYALECGFDSIISYEIKKDLYVAAVERFKGNNKVILHNKSSTKMLEDIKNIVVPITFWLDGHYSAGFTGYDNECAYPVIKELEAIAQHDVKTHTILIDDRRLLKHHDIKNISEIDSDTIGYSESEILEHIMKINPNYKISYEDGAIKDDIIVAKVDG